MSPTTLEHLMRPLENAYEFFSHNAFCGALCQMPSVKYCCGIYVLVTKSPGKSNLHPSTKAARDF